MRRTLFCLWFFNLIGSGSILFAQLPVALPEAINSAYEEREPTLSPDGKTLYFWRREFPDNTGGEFDPGDIWISRKLRNTWSAPLQAPNPLNGRGHDFVWQVSVTGDTLWMMHTAPGVADHGMSYAVADGRGGWKPPRRVHIHDFRYQGNVKDFYLTADHYLFLTQTDTATGYGGSDIYVCRPLNDTAWSEPINLGADINTPGDEDAPYLTPDGKTLYFNSNGHPGLGGHDIFVAQRDGRSYYRWESVENLGAPINSPYYDFDFFGSRDGHMAYYGSLSKSTRSLDLYELDLRSCEVDIYPLHDTILCIGSSLQLNGIYQPGEMSYEWLHNGEPIPSATERTLITQRSGNFQLIRRRPGCSDTSAIRQVLFIDPPQAEIATPTSVLCLDGSIQLQALSPTADRYQWQYEGRNIPNATRETYTIYRPGNYSLTVAEGGCVAQSEPLSVQRFDKPYIIANTDAHGIIPVLPQWIWSNRMDLPRGPAVLNDIATNEREEVFVLTSHGRGRTLEDKLTVYRKQGLQKSRIELGRRAADQSRLVASLPDGNLIIAGSDQILKCISPSGRQAWQVPFEAGKLIGLATDPLGYIYVSGYFDSPLDLAPEVETVPNRGGMYLARYTPDGNLDWINSYPIDKSKIRLDHALTVDQSGNAYLIGHLELIGNFGAGHIARAQMGEDSYFFLSVNAQGESRWVKRLTTGRPQPNRYHALATDPMGNSLLCLNGQVWRIDPQGVVLWEGQLEGNRGDQVVSLQAGLARQDGYFLGITSRDRYFLTKLNRINRQTVIWQAPFSGKDGTLGLSMTTGADQHLYVAGFSQENNLPGIQLDLTSKSRGFLIKYGPPDGSQRQEPIELCSTREVRLETLNDPGLRYQWYRDGSPISGETHFSLVPSSPGTYQVRVFTPECDRLSNPRQVTRCGDDPLDQPLLTVEDDLPPAPMPAEEPDEVEPEPIPESVEPASDDPYSFDGYASNNLILLLDVSGSMRNRDRMPVLQESLIDLVGHMRPEDQISIITYAGGVRTVIDGVSAAEQSRIIEAIENLQSSGATKGKRALRKAYRTARRNYLSEGNNRVIMATDGGFPVQRLYGRAGKMKRQGIILSVFSFGKLGTFKEEILDNLANRGGGNHTNITPENVEKALLQEVKAVRMEADLN